VDGFPTSDLVPPTVAVEAGKVDVQQYELGNRDGLRMRTWYIDIFANNKSQRDEFGYRLLNVLKNGIPVYNYDEGFPPAFTPSKVGVLQIIGKSYNPVRIAQTQDANAKIYYRATVTIVAYDDAITEV
jgi:hypothetical protein